MLKIKIIKARPGKNTTERILELIQKHPEGTTIKKLSKQLNRPVSMVQICLKTLISSKQIYCRKSNNQMSLIYYPKLNP